MKRLTALAALLLCVTATASARQETQQKLPAYTESAGSEYVLVPVVVLDKKGRFVEGLEKKNFQLRVQGVRVDLDTFEKDDNAPASFAFLIDTSGSMRLASKLEYAKSAVRRIVGQRKSGDDFALFAFAEEEVRLVADFSRDPARLLAALDGLEAGGKTAISSFDRLTDEERSQLSVDNLRMLAASSGGKMFLPGGEEDLGPVAEKVTAEVRKQYLLGFTPSGRGALEYRVLVVTVVKPGSWDVRARRGYRGTAPVAATAH